MKNSKATPYALASFASAFLLFLIQPMIAKAITPQFGGTASVWNSALLVGQTLLLIGSFYAYRLLSMPRWTGARVINMALAIIASFVIIVLPEYALQKPLPQWATTVAPEIGVPLLMLASVGPAMMVLGSQSPILQKSWAAKSNDANPYPLYIASNAGSLMGLLAYPFAIEFLADITNQLTAWKWTAAFVMTGSGILVLLSPKISSPASQSADNSSRENITIRAKWLFAPFLAVMVMMSAGQMVTTDIMAMPLVWVFPLGAFLVGYITAFSSRISSHSKAAVTPAHIGLAVLALTSANALISADLAAGVLCIISIGLVTHGLLRPVYESRPPVEGLGRFYLALAAGGALGGLVTATLAPILLDWRWELPIALAVSAYMINPAPSGITEKSTKRRLIFVGFLIAWLAFFAQTEALPYAGIIQLVCALILAAMALLFSSGRKSFLFMIMLVMASSGIIYQIGNSITGNSRRSYYSMATIEKGKTPEAITTLKHGTTVHGMQSRIRPSMPTTYYTDSSGIADIARSLPDEANIGVAGLGAGTLACQVPPQNLTFFEIDAEMVDIARKDFTFLKTCAPQARMQVGDARMLIKNSDDKYDMLVLDAFTSDSIPMHLVTNNALDIYESRLAAGGWLLIHTSNRYLNINAPIAQWAIDKGYTPMVLLDSNSKEPLAAASRWVAIRPDGWIERKNDWTADPRWEPASGGVTWTDNRSSVLQILQH